MSGAALRRGLIGAGLAVVGLAGATVWRQQQAAEACALALEAALAADNARRVAELVSTPTVQAVLWRHRPWRRAFIRPVGEGRIKMGWSGDGGQRVALELDTDELESCRFTESLEEERFFNVAPLDAG